MTYIYILKDLLSRPRNREKRRAIVAAAETALTIWKWKIDKVLGYETSEIDEWIIT